jgi:hypothetical protein
VEAEARVEEILPEEEAEKSAGPVSAATAGPPAPPRAKIDRPNTRRIVRKVLCRDGHRCGNPRCRRKLGLHVHHIKFRSRGGRTEVWNEVAVCAWCHACIHQGFLEVGWDEYGKIAWLTRADKLRGRDLSLKAEIEDLKSTPVVQVAPMPSAPVNPSAAVNPSASADAQSGERASASADAQVTAAKEDRPDIDALASGLVKAGFTKREARARLERVIEKFRRAGRRLIEGDLLFEAFRPTA